MTLDFTVESPTAPPQRFDVFADLVELQARTQWAERKVANLEHALESNRRIGIAIGILMCQRQLTNEQAFDLLRRRSQHGHVKLREVAETVIFTGTL